MRYVLSSKRITSLLRRRGIGSIEELARRTRLHRNTLRPYLRGERDAFAGPVMQIAEALGEDPMRLLEAAGGDAAAVEPRVADLLHRLATAHPALTFVLIGSRARGNAKEFSDYDIGVSGGRTPLDSRAYLRLKSQIEDLAEDLPWSIDVVNLDQAPAWFLRGIDYEPRYLAGDIEAAMHLKGVLHGIRKSKED